jgi:dihydrofolate reductase
MSDSAGTSLPHYSIHCRVFLAVTLDNFIARPDGQIDFLEDYQSSSQGDLGFAQFLETVQVVVMGHASFDKVVSFGASQWAYGNRLVYVCTRQPSDLVVPDYLQSLVKPTDMAPKDIIEDIQGSSLLSAKTGPLGVYIDGGQTVTRFMQEGLIEDVVLTRVPLVLGQGLPWCGPLTRSFRMEHMSTKAYQNGLVTSHYRVIHYETV